MTPEPLGWPEEAKKRIEEISKESGFPVPALVSMFNGLYRSDYIQEKLKGRAPDKALDYLVRRMKLQVQEIQKNLPGHLWARAGKSEGH